MVLKTTIEWCIIELTKAIKQWNCGIGRSKMKVENWNLLYASDRKITVLFNTCQTVVGVYAAEERRKQEINEFYETLQKPI